jgi:hypothetical protein
LLAYSFAEVQKEVADIIQGRIVVGHGLENDFKVISLFFSFLILAHLIFVSFKNRLCFYRTHF